MVPQGADIVALQLDSTTLRCIIDFHRLGCAWLQVRAAWSRRSPLRRCFVKGDAACFLVDDLWCPSQISIEMLICANADDIGY